MVARRLTKLPRSKGARHDLAAGLLHLYASTERIWQPSSAPEHSVYKSDKTVLVREDEVTAWGVAPEVAERKSWRGLRNPTNRASWRQRCYCGTNRRPRIRRNTFSPIARVI